MPDDVEVSLGADTEEGRKEFRRLAAEIEKTGVVIKQVAEQGEKTGNRITEAMGSAVGTIGKVAVGYLTVETAIRAATKAMELYNATLKHQQELGDKARATREGLAPGRAGAIREALPFYGTGDEVDTVAKSLAQRFLIKKDSAYGIIGSASGAAGDLSRAALQSHIEEAARITHFDASQDSTALANLLVRTRKALGVGSGSQTAGFLGQFADSTSEQAALAEVLQTARQSKTDPREAGAVFEHLSNIADSAGEAGNITASLLNKGQYASKVESGFTQNREGKTVPRVVEIGGTGLDRIRHYAKAFQQASPEQRKAMLQKWGVRGSGAEEAGVAGMLSDPRILAQIEARAGNAAAPGTTAAANEGNRVLREVSGGAGRDWSAAQAREAAKQLDEEQNEGAARLESIRASALQVVDKAGYGEVGRDYWRRRITDGMTALSSADSLRRYMKGERFKDDPLKTINEMLDTSSSAGLLNGANNSVQNLRNEMGEFSKTSANFKANDDRLYNVMNELNESIKQQVDTGKLIVEALLSVTRQAPGARSHEVY